MQELNQITDKLGFCLRHLLLKLFPSLYFTACSLGNKKARLMRAYQYVVKKSEVPLQACFRAIGGIISKDTRQFTVD